MKETPERGEMHKNNDNNKEVTANTGLISRINSMATKQNLEKEENKDINEASKKNDKHASEVDAKIITSAKRKEHVHLDNENLPGEQNILEVKVEKATKYFIDKESIYRLKSNFKGFAVIINNDKFTKDEYSTRTGSLVDERNLSEIFRQLGLEVVIHRNMTRKATLNFVIDFSSDPAHSKADMMVFCMATHGPERSRLMSADCLEIDVEKDILRSFNNESCPGLRGKPKFFIFQACQGQEKDYGVEKIRGSQTDSWELLEKCGSGPPGSALKDPGWEDMLIAYSTLPGFVSYRDVVRGTWFIDCLCQVFMEHSCDTSLRDMLDMVARGLKEKQTESGAKQSFKYEVIHFYKKLYFHPGLSPT
jgi:caspase-like apoptosis-related cysteine protease